MIYEKLERAGDGRGEGGGRSLGLENKFLDCLCRRGEHMQKMEPGIATGTVNSPETIPTGRAFHPRFFVSPSSTVSTKRLRETSERELRVPSTKR